MYTQFFVGLAVWIVGEWDCSGCRSQLIPSSLTLLYNFEIL